MDVKTKMEKRNGNEWRDAVVIEIVRKVDKY